MASTVWKGHITFGLVSIPVKLYRAARAERVNLRELYRSAPERDADTRADVVEFPAPGSAAALSRRGRQEAIPLPEPPEPPAPDRPEIVEPVRHAAVTEGGERPIPKTEIVKGYEYQPEQWVVLDREEIKRIAPKTSPTMQITEFVHFGEIDPIYLEASYYVVPDRTGEKAYAILFAALRETGFAALAEVAMHNREHVVILRPGNDGIIGHTMYYVDEVRRDLEYHSNLDLVADRELEVAKKLVEALAGKFEPEKYRDKYRERLENLIAAKIQGRDFTAQAPAAQTAAPVVDILEALQKSLASIRKPPQQAKAEPAAKKKTRRGGR